MDMLEYFLPYCRYDVLLFHVTRVVNNRFSIHGDNTTDGTQKVSHILTLSLVSTYRNGVRRRAKSRLSYRK